MRRWENIFHENGKQKKAGVAILISDKIDLERKYCKREGRTLQNDQRINPRRIYNNYKYICTNIGAPQYIRQTLTDIEGEIDSNTIIVGDFNAPLIPMNRSSKQKINKKTQVLNNALDEMDLIDISRTFHSNAEECTFFSSAHGTFSRIDHILGHKSNLSKFKKIEIISSIFSKHNSKRLNINYKEIKNTKKHKHMEIK